MGISYEKTLIKIKIFQKRQRRETAHVEVHATYLYFIRGQRLARKGKFAVGSVILVGALFILFFVIRAYKEEPQPTSLASRGTERELNKEETAGKRRKEPREEETAKKRNSQGRS